MNNKRISQVISLLVGTLSLVVHADLASTQLNNTLQSSIQNYLQQDKSALYDTSVQLSVILPNETAPRDYVVGTQYEYYPRQASNTMMLQWGSITKEYTDALVMKLAEQGKVQMNETLGQIFPEQFAGANNAWPLAWENVTVTELMNMTSGIPNYVSLLPRSSEAYAAGNLVNVVAQYQQKQGCLVNMACFAAGSEWGFSNTNSLILGLIVEKETGLSFDQAIEENVLAPFQTGNSSVYYSTNYPANIAANMIHGYQPFTAGVLTVAKDMTNFDMSWLGSGGAMIGNMDSLARMTQALYNGQIVPVNSFENQLVQVPSGAPVTNVASQCAWNPTQGASMGSCYGMGMMTAYDPKAGQFWWYQGETLGYQTDYLWFPAEKVTIAIGQNSRGLDEQALLREALEIHGAIDAYLATRQKA